MAWEGYYATIIQKQGTDAEKANLLKGVLLHQGFICPIQASLISDSKRERGKPLYSKIFRRLHNLPPLYEPLFIPEEKKIIFVFGGIKKTVDAGL